MPDTQSFLVLDSSGAPVTGLAAALSSGAIARDPVGGVRAAPPVVELASGLYGVTASLADENAGMVVHIDCGAGRQPRRVTLAFFRADRANQFVAWHVENAGDGTYWTGAAPTTGVFRDSSGPRTPKTPRPVESTWLFVLVPDADDIAADTHFRIDGPAGSAQAFLYGSTVPVSLSDATDPVVSNVTPPAGAVITPETTLSFDVTDAGGNLSRTNVSVYYPSLQRWEVLFYAAITGAWGSRAQGFGPQYEGNRAPITNGFRFTGVRRRGGWPARPVVVVDPVDSAGNEAV